MGLYSILPAIADGPILDSIRQRNELVLQRAETIREEAARRRCGEFFRDLARHHFSKALITYVSGKPPDFTRYDLRRGAGEFLNGVELGWIPDGTEMQDALDGALIAGDSSTAYAICAIPDEEWVAEPPAKVALYAEFALFRGEITRAVSCLEALAMLGFDDPGLASEPYHHLFGCLQALVSFNDQALPRFLIRYVETRSGKRQWRGMIRPEFDAAALGLCVIARQRGLTPDVRNLNIGIDLLETFS